MTLKQAIQKAIETDNIYLVAQIVETCRFRDGLNYNNLADLFKRCAGIDKDDFEMLMIRLDEQGF